MVVVVEAAGVRSERNRHGKARQPPTAKASSTLTSPAAQVLMWPASRLQSSPPWVAGQSQVVMPLAEHVPPFWQSQGEEQEPAVANGAHRPAPHGTHCGAEGLLFTSAVFAGHCAAAGRHTTLATTSQSNTGNCLLGVPVIICGVCG